MTKTYRRLFGDVGNFNARIEDNVGGMRVVQSFANEEHEKELFAVDNQNFRKTKLLAYKTMAKSISVSYKDDATGYGVCHDQRGLVLYRWQNQYG